MMHQIALLGSLFFKILQHMKSHLLSLRNPFMTYYVHLQPRISKWVIVYIARKSKPLWLKSGNPGGNPQPYWIFWAWHSFGVSEHQLLISIKCNTLIIHDQKMPFFSPSTLPTVTFRLANSTIFKKMSPLKKILLF